jgi:hypothetical protein
LPTVKSVRSPRRSTAAWPALSRVPQSSKTTPAPAASLIACLEASLSSLYWRLWRGVGQERCICAPNCQKRGHALHRHGERTKLAIGWLCVVWKGLGRYGQDWDMIEAKQSGSEGEQFRKRAVQKASRSESEQLRKFRKRAVQKASSSESEQFRKRAVQKAKQFIVRKVSKLQIASKPHSKQVKSAMCSMLSYLCSMLSSRCYFTVNLTIKHAVISCYFTLLSYHVTSPASTLLSAGADGVNGSQCVLGQQAAHLTLSSVVLILRASAMLSAPFAPMTLL